MRRIRDFSAAAAILLAAAVLAPGGASAQSAAGEGVKSTAAEWVGTAEALAQSAARAPTSEASCMSLIAAANAYRAGGRLSLARQVALKAAREARHAGLAETAARAYLAAATLSEDLNEPDVALGYYAQCRQLADLKPMVRVQ